MQYYNNVSPKVFSHPNTCHDSIEGKCLYGLSREKCQDYCKKNDCTYGFFVNKNQLTNQEISDIHAENSGRDSLCFTSLTRKIHPLEFVEETKRDIDFFVKKGVFETHYRGNIDFMDKVFMTTRAGELMFGGQPLQVWKPYTIYVEHLRYGDSINIRKFMTNVYLFANICKHAAEFLHNSSIYFTNELDFFIMNKEKAAGEFVKYGDYFYIQTKNKLILTKNLELKYADPEILSLGGAEIYFKFSPEFDVFYCDGPGNCVPAAAADLNDSFKFRGNEVYRNNNCYLNC
jgi:hypothetical protein